MYDDFSQDYDRFINWDSRLAYELPFIETQLTALQNALGYPIQLIDVATGTGMHAIALEKHGYRTVGVDQSKEMIIRSRENARVRSSDVTFIQTGFGELQHTFQTQQSTSSRITRTPGIFDAVLCLGNSLPHVLSRELLEEAILDFYKVLSPGGLLLIQNRNFDSVMEKLNRWMEPQSFSENDDEWIYIRFYDFRPDGLLDFNIVVLHRSHLTGWSQRIHTTQLFPQRGHELDSLLSNVGFEKISFFGGLDGSVFEPENSGNLVIIANKPHDNS